MKKITMMMFLFAVSLFAGASNVMAQDLTCTGTVNGGTAQNVIVPANAACSIIGTQIFGNIEVQAGSRLDARGVRLAGSVQADGALAVLVRANSFIAGNIEVKNTRTVTIARVTVGDVQLEANTGALNVSFSTINGELLASQNLGRVSFLSNPLVRGDIKAEGNLNSVTITGNRTEGNVQAFGNNNGVTITNNWIRQDLQCGENLPATVQSGNTIGGNLQCQ